MRVLVADDERLLADTVADGLRRLAMAVDVCHDGDAALERLSVNRYDVAVLDRDMPGRTGDDLCRYVISSGLERPACCCSPLPPASGTGSTACRWAPTTT